MRSYAALFSNPPALRWRIRGGLGGSSWIATNQSIVHQDAFWGAPAIYGRDAQDVFQPIIDDAVTAYSNHVPTLSKLVKRSQDTVYTVALDRPYAALAHDRAAWEALAAIAHPYLYEPAHHAARVLWGDPRGLIAITLLKLMPWACDDRLVQDTFEED